MRHYDCKTATFPIVLPRSLQPVLFLLLGVLPRAPLLCAASVMWRNGNEVGPLVLKKMNTYQFLRGWWDTVALEGSPTGAAVYCLMWADSARGSGLCRIPLRASFLVVPQVELKKGHRHRACSHPIAPITNPLVQLFNGFPLTQQKKGLGGKGIAANMPPAYEQCNENGAGPLRVSSDRRAVPDGG